MTEEILQRHTVVSALVLMTHVRGGHCRQTKANDLEAQRLSLASRVRLCHCKEYLQYTHVQQNV